MVLIEPYFIPRERIGDPRLDLCEDPCILPAFTSSWQICKARPMSRLGGELRLAFFMSMR